MGERIASVLFLLASATGLAAQEPAAPAGPISYWKFDETSGTTAANVVASGPAGVYKPTGLPTPNATVPLLSYNSDPGVTPRSLQFDGTSQGVQVTNLAPSLSTYTLALWLQRTGATGTRESLFSFKESGSGFVLSLNEDGANFRPRIWSNINGAWQNVEEAFTIPLTVWIHLAATYDGTNLRLYRDFGAPSSGTFAGTLGGSVTSTGIGMRNSYDMHYFPGLIDDVRMYNRAQNASEIAVLAAGVPAPTGVTATGDVHQITVSWTAPPQNVPYTYRVLSRPAGSTGAYTVLDPAFVGTTYVDLAATGGLSFEYAIRAVSVAESGLSGTATATSIMPLPRYEDHEEGSFDGNCTCGSASAKSPGLLLLLGLLSFVAILRRRS